MQLWSLDIQYKSLYNCAFLVNGFAYYFSHINDIIFFFKREIAECSKRSDASCGTNLGMQLRHATVDMQYLYNSLPFVLGLFLVIQ